MAEHEEYIENIHIRRDNVHIPVGDGPTFVNAQCDKIFEFEGTVKLIQIVESVQNATHNTHSYIFVIESIDKFEEQED